MSDNARMLEQAHKANEATTIVAQLVINYRNTLIKGGFPSFAADTMCTHMHETLMRQISVAQTR